MILQSRRVWLDHSLQPAQIEIENGKIKAVLRCCSVHPDIDYGENWILPGFIDIHTHGMSGMNAETMNAAELRMWQQALAQEGVTSFVAALATQSHQATMASLKRLSGLVHTGTGADFLGMFLEGNYINPDFSGSQDKAFIQTPSITELDQYIEAAGNHLLRMILAVEKDENYEVLRHAVSRGIEVSAGHSAAAYAQINEAIALGLTSLTHTYNAMSSFHHRETGLIGAALLQDSLYTELIADGFHTCWEAAAILARNKDSRHLILVSDASTYKLYQDILPSGLYRDEKGQIRTASHALAGSVLKMNEGINNLITKANVPVVSAINAATDNPARLLKIDHYKGSIRCGYDADLVIAASDFKVIQTFCKGIMMKEELS